MSDNWTGTGYNAEASTGGGLYLRLKKKGEKVRLRLVSDCYRYTDVLPAKDGEEAKILRKAAWVAIHKFMEGGKPQKKVVVFTNGPMVYGLIKDLAENEAWGDPKLFDIEIERTEEAGKYYTVQPLPKPIGPLSEDEAAMVAEAGIDLVKACTGESGGSQADPPAEEAEDPFQDD